MMIRSPNTAHGRGQRVSASLPLYGSNRLAAFIGDSLTEHDFGSTPHYWHLGLQGAPLELLANSGFSGQSTFGLISQIDNNYKLNTAPGLAGLPYLGVVFLRIDTNGAQSAFSSGADANQRAVITKLLTYADNVVVFAVPPIGTIGGSPNGAYVVDYNANWQAICAENPTRLHYVDDCADIRDGAGNSLAEFFIADRIHMNGAGGYQMALTAEARLASLFASRAYVSPLVTDSADVYPATDQWSINPTNVGTGGSASSGWTGSVINAGSVQNYGAGGTGVASIVAADGGDPNTDPWQRLTPATCEEDGGIVFSVTGAGRTVDASNPDTLDQVVQLRFNNFSQYTDLYYNLHIGGVGSISKRGRLRWGGSIGANRTVVLRQKFYRVQTGYTGTPGIRIDIAGGADFSGDMGSVDIRYASTRG